MDLIYGLNNIEKYEVVEEKNIFVDNHPVYSSLTYTPSTQDKNLSFYFNNPDQYILQILYRSSIKSFDTYLKDIQTIINSLKFLR